MCAWLTNIAFISICKNNHVTVPTELASSERSLRSTGLFSDIWITSKLLRPTSEPRPSATDWQSDINLCIDLSGPTTRDTTLAILSTETFLLLVMLVGFLRERDHRLGRFLFNKVITLSCWFGDLADKLT
jgi:hypothetical protein